MSPTARTLAYFEQRGYVADVCERFIHAVQQKRDLFGIADVVGVHPVDRAVLLVQCTSADHVADRLRRIQARPELRPLLLAGVAVEVWGWCLRAGRWHVRRVALRVEDLQAVEVQALPRRRRPRRGERQRDLFADHADGTGPVGDR